jgi:hypothetical protein
MYVTLMPNFTIDVYTNAIPARAKKAKISGEVDRADDSSSQLFLMYEEMTKGENAQFHHRRVH